jgi:hypothetical protein
MIFLPATCWTQLLKEFRRQRRRVEQVAYLDGVRLTGGGVVTTFTLPNAALSPGRFAVSADAMSEAGGHLREFRLVRLAQVHTHPKDWVGHSLWDDAQAYSQQVGALSIVLPQYGRRASTLQDAGIHVREESGWRQIRLEEVPSIIQLLPSALDFRRK